MDLVDSPFTDGSQVQAACSPLQQEAFTTTLNKVYLKHQEDPNRPFIPTGQGHDISRAEVAAAAATLNQVLTTLRERGLAEGSIFQKLLATGLEPSHRVWWTGPSPRGCS